MRRNTLSFILYPLSFILYPLTFILYPFSFFLFTLTLFLPACTPSPYRQGESLYKTHCASCHMDDGLGLRGVIPPVAASDYIARDPAYMACIIRYGLAGEIVVNGTVYNQPMEGIPQLSEFQIANIINYINSSWGNDFGFVSMPQIQRQLEGCAAQEGD